MRILRTQPEIDGLRDTWTSWQSHPNSDMDFYLTILRTRARILHPHVIVVDRGGLPDAMLIGRVEDGQMDIRIGYKTFFRPRARVLAFVYGGLLGDPSTENCALFVSETVRSLRFGEADLAVLSHLKVDSEIYRLARKSPSLWSRDFVSSRQLHRSMTVPPTVEDFYRRLSPKVRKNQRWQAKKLLSDFPGQVRVHCFRRPDELDQMFRDVETVAKKTYQRGLGVGFEDNSEMRERFSLEASKLWLRAFVLYVAQQPCAFWIGCRYGQTFHSNFMGYDPGLGKYSPGMFLVMKVIEAFCGRSGGDIVDVIDFGLGDAQYKSLLGDHEWQEQSVQIFAPTLRGMHLNLLRTPLALTEQFVRRRLKQANVLQAIKKEWRAHLKKETPEQKSDE